MLCSTEASSTHPTSSCVTRGRQITGFPVQTPGNRGVEEGGEDYQQLGRQQNVPSRSRATPQGPGRMWGWGQGVGEWALVLPKLSTPGSVDADVLGHLVGPVHPPWSLPMSCFTK